MKREKFTPCERIKWFSYSTTLQLHSEFPYIASSSTNFQNKLNKLVT